MAQNADMQHFGAARGIPGSASHEDSHGEDHAKLYYMIFTTLVVLTAITVGVAFIHISHEWLKVLIALAIASVKAACVAWIFMHLKWEGKLVYIAIIVPLILCVILVSALIPDIVMPGLHDQMMGRPPLPEKHE
jgi:caa(3)-type oxidase subunit IV